MRHRLRKHEILTDRKKILEIYSSGIKVDGSVISCLYLKQEDSQHQIPRLSVCFHVRGTSFNAVKRNRCRRLMREAFRVIRPRISWDTDSRVWLLFRPHRDRVTVPSYKEVHDDMEAILLRVMVPKKKKGITIQC